MYYLFSSRYLALKFKWVLCFVLSFLTVSCTDSPSALNTTGESKDLRNPVIYEFFEEDAQVSFLNLGDLIDPTALNSEANTYRIEIRRLAGEKPPEQIDLRFASEENVFEILNKEACISSLKAGASCELAILATLSQGQIDDFINNNNGQSVIVIESDLLLQTGTRIIDLTLNGRIDLEDFGLDTGLELRDLGDNLLNAVDFGNVVKGDQEVLTVSLINETSADLVISSILQDGNEFGMNLNSSCLNLTAQRLGANQSCEYTLTFDALDVDNVLKTGLLLVSIAGGAIDKAIPLTATVGKTFNVSGLGSGFGSASSRFRFGEVRISTEEVEQLRITNKTDLTRDFNTSLSGSNTFSVGGAFTLLPDQPSFLNISFRPTQIQHYSGYLSIFDPNDPEDRVQISLEGSGAIDPSDNGSGSGSGSGSSRDTL